MLSREELNRLFRYCLSLTLSKSSAEDLLHSSIERTLRRQGSIDNVSAYVRRVARNLFIDECRRRQVVDFEPLEEGAPALMDESSLEQIIIDEDRVERLLKELGNAERECLFLWAVEGYTAAEISIELDEPRGTILARLYRMKKRIRAIEDRDADFKKNRGNIV